MATTYNMDRNYQWKDFVEPDPDRGGMKTPNGRRKANINYIPKGRNGTLGTDYVQGNSLGNMAKGIYSALPTDAILAERFGPESLDPLRKDRERIAWNYALNLKDLLWIYRVKTSDGICLIGIS